MLLVIWVGNMTLAIPEGLKRKMQRHPEVRWSAIARETFERKAEELEFMDSILKDSRLTEQDAEEIGHNIKAEISRRFRKRFGKWK